MREISFRGKRLDNGEWVEGFLICPLFDKSRAYIGTLFAVDDHDTDVAEVDPETVGQFTGLTDRNGVRIFEGDFLQELDNGKIGFVAWSDRAAGFVCRYKTDYYDTNGLIDLRAKRARIIGNKFDTPELLKGGENNG